MRWFIWIMACVVAGTLQVAPAMACGPDTDCMIGDRSYRIRMPSGYDSQTETKAKIGALIFMHGYKGSSAGTIRNKNLMKAADELGVALVAPKSDGNDWDLPGVPQNPQSTGEAEFQYFDALVADLDKRFSIDTNRLVATGFSAGGMMVWNLACHRGHLFAGFIPMSGTFWDPLPRSCPSKPVHLIHMHGTSDRVVPLAGRPIAETHQGDVLEAIALFTDKGEFERESPLLPLDLRCKRRTNAEGRILELCLHEGGHRFRSSYLTWAWSELERAGGL